MNSPELQHKVFLLLLVAVSVAFGTILLPFYGAVFWACVLAIMFTPFYRRLLVMMPKRENLAAFATLLLGMVATAVSDAVLPAAHAKKFATDMAVQRIADCIQAMGANGLRAEYPLARHLAGAKIAAYTDGSIEMMNERIGAALPQVFG